LKSANQTRSVLLVVLPYRLGDATTDTSKKAVRSFLPFPYGVLTLASYVRRFAENLNEVAILDLNLPCGEAPDVLLKRKISEMQPDVVGFSMSYDVSYRWLKSLAEVVKTHDSGICTVAGGPAVAAPAGKLSSKSPRAELEAYTNSAEALVPASLQLGPIPTPPVPMPGQATL